MDQILFFILKSNEYFPGPHINTIIKPRKNKIALKPATEKEIIDFCRKTLAGFKLPKKVIFSDLPKTSTGKIQKFELRKKF